MEDRVDKDTPNPESSDVRNNLEVSSQPARTEQSEIRTNEEELLAEVRRSIQQHPIDVQAPAPQTSASIRGEKLAGFRQKPLKVLRNFFLYPDLSKTVIISSGAAALGVTTFLFESPSPLPVQVFSLLDLAFISGEFINLFRRTKNVSRFLDIRRVRASNERVLADGTKIGLDDTIGELHFSPKGMLGLAFERNKTKRALIIGESVIQGLVDLADKVENNDPKYKDIAVFKGTSTFVSPHQATRLGFEVTKPEGFTSTTYSYLLPFDKFITASPSNTKVIHTAWISRQGLVEHKGGFQRELTTIQSALNRRTT